MFGWRITETTDAFGNLVRYTYARDHGDEPGHAWDQPMISRIEYADYGDRADPSFLVRVDFDYEQRPDPFSDYRAGFEIRTTLRCRDDPGVHPRGRRRRARGARVPLRLRAGTVQRRLAAHPRRRGRRRRPDPGQPRHEPLPPLTFGYTAFEPQRRRFGRGHRRRACRPARSATRRWRWSTCAAAACPTSSSSAPPPGYWRNRGGGRFELPRADAGGAAAAPRRTGRAVHRRRRRRPRRPAGQVGEPRPATSR